MSSPSATRQSKPGGALIDSLFLYSEQCSILLRQALEREEANKTSEQVNPYHARVTYKEDSSDSEYDDEQQMNHPSSSSSSSEGEEEPEESTRIEAAPEAGQTGQTSSQPKPPQHQPKKKKKVKRTQTEIERQNAVRKHVENLVCDALPINDSEAIHVSTSLLAKQPDSIISERNYVPQSPCQEYLELSETLQRDKNVLVLLLRSGRFAAAIFRGSKCLVHRACQRYTVRKGQGKAQSTQDASRRPKSMGAQLRRAGEEGLQEDIRETFASWKSHIPNTALILLACPKGMRKYLFDAIDADIFAKDDPRLRRLPLDVGRPTFENVCIAHQVLMTVQIRQLAPVAAPAEDIRAETKPETKITAATIKDDHVSESSVIFPLTPLHEACRDGDVETVENMLSNLQQEVACAGEDEGEEPQTIKVEQMIHRRVGPDFMTCLHYAAAGSDPETAAACVTQLLIQAKADPGIQDARRRPPYFLATHDKVRDAFRMARATLGEDYCRWDESAKVGPPLTLSDVQAKKEREAEKKRKKRARQKQKKAQEKAQAELEQKQQEQKEQARQQEEAAKRVRDGLQPKVASTGTGTVCDFCQVVVKGRKRKDMFSRLDYVYCSAECVQKHKRELMAAAAMSRFGG